MAEHYEIPDHADTAVAEGVVGLGDDGHYEVVVEVAVLENPALRVGRPGIR